MAPAQIEPPFSLATYATNNWPLIAGCVTGLYYLIKLVWNFGEYTKAVEKRFDKLEAELGEMKEEVRRCLSCRNQAQDQRS